MTLRASALAFSVLAKAVVVGFPLKSQLAAPLCPRGKREAHASAVRCDFQTLGAGAMPVAAEMQFEGVTLFLPEWAGNGKGKTEESPWGVWCKCFLRVAE